MVNKVTPALFQRAPTPEAMAATPIPEIQALIREVTPLPTQTPIPLRPTLHPFLALTLTKAPLRLISLFVPQVGLAPSKAKYLQGLAAQLIERHDGKVPRTLEELEALPGVGHKTAGVMMSQGFGARAGLHGAQADWGPPQRLRLLIKAMTQPPNTCLCELLVIHIRPCWHRIFPAGVPAFPVDTHIHRLAQRWGLTNGHSVEQTEADLMSLIPKDRWVRRSG